jgi:hypothetical protein
MTGPRRAGGPGKGSKEDEGPGGILGVGMVSPRGKGIPALGELEVERLRLGSPALPGTLLAQTTLYPSCLRNDPVSESQTVLPLSFFSSPELFWKYHDQISLILRKVRGQRSRQRKMKDLRTCLMDRSGAPKLRSTAKRVSLVVEETMPSQRPLLVRGEVAVRYKWHLKPEIEGVIWTIW